MGANLSVLAGTAILIATFSSISMVQANPVPVGPTVYEMITGGIWIDNNSGFLTNDRIWTGSGTWSDPYVMSNVGIIPTAGLTPTIRIHNTTDFFRLSKIWVNPYGIKDLDQTAIDIGRVSNGTIIRCDVNGFDTAIYISDSSNITIAYNDLHATDSTTFSGIEVIDSSSTTVLGNIIRDYMYGVYAGDTIDSRIAGNTVAAKFSGVYLDDCADVTIDGNSVTTPDYDYYDSDWTDNVWTSSHRVIDETNGRLLLFGVVVPACAVMAGAVIGRGRRDANAPR